MLYGEVLHAHAFIGAHGPDKGKVFVLMKDAGKPSPQPHAYGNHLQDTDVARVQCEVSLDGDILVVTDLDAARRPLLMTRRSKPTE